MSTQSGKVIGIIGTTVGWLTWLALVFTAGVMIWKDAPISEFFTKLWPLVLGLMLLHFMGKYYAAKKELDEHKSQDE